MSLTETFLESSDGIRLFLRRWDAPSSKAVCLLVHGFAEHGGRYENLAHNLMERRFSVWAMDNRGHGRSGGARGDCASLQSYTADLEELIARVRSENGARPFFLIGHSLGGLIALAKAAENPAGLSGVAVSSPALKLALPLPKIKVAVTEILARTVPGTPVPNGVDPSLLSRDPEVVRAYKKDPLVFRSITARCAVVLRDAMADALSYAPKIRVPCLILQAGADRICDAQRSAEFAAAVRQDLVTFNRYDGFYHELFNEPEKERVILALGTWLDSLS